MKPYVGGGVQISLGGTWDLQSAIDNKDNFACADIDIISVHSYGWAGANYTHLIVKLGTIASLVMEANPPQRVIFEEFGQVGPNPTQRGVVLGDWMAAVNSVGIPFMPWQLMKPGNTCVHCMNFWIGDGSWTQLVTWTAIAARTPGRFSWPELTVVPRLRQGDRCTVSGQCESGCCGNGYPKHSDINVIFTCWPAGSKYCTGFYCPYPDGGCDGVTR
mmetsp:Transcript_91212/g.178544  ORF Transcript_91212/g.178544 Transcript_91212/m.178544 type:complete len:217 (-) Transcript_91212:348-998(-)